MPANGLSFPLKADYDRVNQSLFDLSVVDGDADAISMAHPFEGPGRGLTVMPQLLLPQAHDEVPLIEGDQPPAPVVESEVPLLAGEGAVMDAMSNAVPEPHQEQPSTVLTEAPPVIQTVPNPLEESETLRNEEKQFALEKIKEDQAELEKQFAR